MPNPATLLAYTDIQDVMDRAMAAQGRGCRVPIGPANDPRHLKAAKYFVSRCNSFRKLHRKDSKRLYPEGHSMHGQSPYDQLRVAVTQSEILGCSIPFICVYLERRRPGAYEVIDNETNAVIPSPNHYTMDDYLSDELGRPDPTNKDFLLE